MEGDGIPGVSLYSIRTAFPAPLPKEYAIIARSLRKNEHIQFATTPVRENGARRCCRNLRLTFQVTFVLITASILPGAAPAHGRRRPVIQFGGRQLCGRARQSRSRLVSARCWQQPPAR